MNGAVNVYSREKGGKSKRLTSERQEKVKERLLVLMSLDS